MSNLTKLEEVASRLMAGMLASSAWDRVSLPNVAEGAVSAAKALLAECAKHEPTTEQSSAVAPDDTWLVRVPTDPIPETCSAVRFADGEEREEACDKISWPKASWNHTTEDKDCHITHYKP